MSSGGSESRSDGRSQWAALTIVLIVFGFALLRIVGWLLRVDARWVWDYGPAWNAFIVHLYRTGAPLYPAPSYLRSPTIYTPLVLLVTSVVAPLFGHGTLAALAAGRSLVLLSTLVVCVMIFMLARRFGASTAASLIVSLAFLCGGLLQPWGFEFRVDMPALAFELTALWVFQAGYGFTAVVFCVLAFFSKQSSIAAIGAITLFSWLDGKRGQAVALAGFWLAAVSLLTLLAQWLWPFYLTNTVRVVSADYLDPWAAPTFLRAMLEYDTAITILGVCALLYRRVNRLALLFLVIAVLENIASSLRWGSYIYYFLPTLAALTIVAAPTMDALLEKFAKLGRLGQVACGLIVALIIPLGNIGTHSPRDC